MDSVAKAQPAGLNKTETLSRSKAISIELRRVARLARVPRPLTSGGGGFRARRSDRYFRLFFMLSFILIVILPASLAGFYYAFIAANQYVTEARFSVSSGSQMDLSSLANISSLLSGGQSSDAQIIAEYAKSRTIIEQVQKTIDLRTVFNPGTLDILAQAPSDMTIEEFVIYWQKQVRMSVNRTSGLIKLTVRAFSPEDSLALASEIVRISEGMVNQLTRRNEENALRETAQELDLAKQRLEEAVSSLRDARIEAGVLDVELTAAGYTELLTALQIDLSKLEIQIGSLKSNNAANAPQLASLEARAQSLRQQISDYENRIAGRATGSEDPSTLAVQAGLLANKQIELSIAQNEYKMAVSSHESARLSMAKQRSYLMVYVHPSLPEESVYPKRGLMWLIISFGAFLVWAIVAGLAILVRDNMAA